MSRSCRIFAINVGIEIETSTSGLRSVVIGQDVWVHHMEVRLLRPDAFVFGFEGFRLFIPC